VRRFSGVEQPSSSALATSPKRGVGGAAGGGGLAKKIGGVIAIKTKSFLCDPRFPSARQVFASLIYEM